MSKRSLSQAIQYSQCIVNGCLTSVMEKNRKFYRFPQKDKKRCLQWIQASGKPELQRREFSSIYRTCRFCDLHFAPSDFDAKGYLKPNVVPTLRLPGEEEDENTKSTQTKLTVTCFCLDEIIALKGYCNAYDKKGTIKPKIEAHCSKCVAKTVSQAKLKAVTRLSVKTQTGIALLHAETQTSNNDLIPKAQKKNRYKKKIFPPRPPPTPQDIKFLEDQMKIVYAEEPNLQKQIYKIIKLQPHLQYSNTGNRYDKEYKNIARNIYLASPLAYKILAKKFPMPSVVILRKENFNLGLTISELVIRKLKAKLKGKLGESRKTCIICADEMVLQRRLINKETVNGMENIKEVKTKEPHTTALVLMARGLFNKWSQPLAFCMSTQRRPAQELLEWVDETIRKVMELGYDVVGFTSSQAITCIRMATQRAISPIQPFFYVNNKKIHYFFDILSLMKTIRNVFLDNNFTYRDCNDTERVATWKDVENLYEIEKERPYQIAYRLALAHISPKAAEKQKLKLALQLFSKSVSVGMLSLISSNVMPESAIGTAKFIELMNDLFDILNSLPFCETNVYKQAFVSKDYQAELLNNVIYFLNTVLVTYRPSGKDVTDGAQCLKQLQVTVKSVLNLSLELQIKDATNRLYTRRLNQEVSARFFAAIRRGAGNSKEPTPHQFIFGFKKISENAHQLY